MDNDTSEIDKLTERIAKDPKSKLFVPLAEEYKKIGNIDMAIQVLTDGLKISPGYVTARSFLGRLLLDRGDIAGAQKELEEVIKAIPDNLLAQRKLGDIYVLQGRGSDAQQRYKAAHALNPADKELPSLIADLEAGKDVSARIPGPKLASATSAPQSAPSPSQPKTAPQVTVKPAASSPVSPAAAQKSAPAAPITPKTVAPQVAAAALKTETVSAAPAAPKTGAAPVVPVAPKTEAAPVAPTAPKTGEAPVVPIAPKTSAAPVVPVAPKTEAAPATPTAAKTEAASVVVAKPVVQSDSPLPAVQTRDEAEVVEEIVEIEHLEKPALDTGLPAFDIPTKPDTSMAEAFEAPAFDLSDATITASTDAGDLADISWGSDTFSVPPVAAAEESPASSDEGGDDLNTNTLAELYISQGFYDKAIEVYQGMLGERPDNKSLQEKLEKLRALAQAADQGIAESPATVPLPQEPVPPAAAVVAEPQPPVDVPVPAPEKAPEQTRAASQPEGPREVETAFEKVLRQADPENTAGRGPRAATARRKETIDRLESWLTNLMKEKK